jgi:hypothetical protein
MRPNGVKAQHALRAAAKPHRPPATRPVAAAKKAAAAPPATDDRVQSALDTLDRLTAYDLAVRGAGGSTGDPALDARIAAFDQSAALQAEMQREMNVLREMAMEQRKRDDEILKKWIALI